MQVGAVIILSFTLLMGPRAADIEAPAPCQCLWPTASFEALRRTGRFQGRALPPRLALGRDAVQVIGAALDKNREALDEWKDLVSTTDCDDVAT
ncbi:uncharacterized protein P174DRAFT_445543 [Aspergillus novofumigatus IBT 16806]|uniref:Uncharacterized protein n=1 Tax=Aspergillus novofumigatus (strain IBT 16806) TaxID=1392255 RepID=A0A2I1BW55_ASPN1|nr:uncharacterized protein P174DRAFT_445543 [Aspergillus novofumigatus IBT 16806]PKX89617.1 hypothetical protein P174DRAFT_445543 [Aspergillus novofumigatus IBT 16806]